MTTEEKAKAYDEALERARKIHSEIVNNELLGFPGQIEDIFPQLRESEDEKIRQELVNFLQSPFVKENLTDEKVAPWLAYLEKQKENPKSADSISSDCVSNAKCEDRWHKVADFLPDSGRDVLAKDALGNYLLASFDGDQWFVSVYDGEDKPIAYTPAIKEWCDIPSEKQKEQKPCTDFVTEPHEGDDNNPYDMRVPEAHEYAIKRGFDIPFNYGEVYVDERHMTQTIGNILRWADEHPKEQKHPDGCFTCDEYKKGYEEGRRNGFTAGYNKGYKDAEKQYNESVAYHYPIMPKMPACWEPGGTCTNPHMDCINCPRKTTGGGFNTASGTSTSTLHGNTSATDGKEHNPSFTD